jgi:ribosomal protein S2
MLADISGIKKKAYLKAKIEELETNSKINNIRDLYRGINDFKKRYQPRTIIVKDEKGDSIAYPTVLRRGGGTISLGY